MKSALAALIAIVIILCPPVFAAELSVTSDNGTVVIVQDGTCTEASVLKHIKPEFHARFHSGHLVYEWRQVQLCWTLWDDAETVVIVDEDGEVTPVPVMVFARKPQLGI